ncbi:hypothetical protein MVEG_10031 [Podila verticillata NRRL 6337]|nr:MAG: actin interacting protein 3-domain-containing protein [Podila humilis]KFH64206.1 hypothetical protein MVEG_10031 [Podila verticillata NRRL 6337]
MDPIQEYPRQSLDYGSPPSHASPTTTSRRRKTDQGTSPIEQTVTKLLVATKQLLEGLTLWSMRKMSEEQVSDIFVQLATQFNLASQSFHEVGIDTSELAHIPDDLRNCLETALGEEPSPSSLDQYLPKIKEVIINLLQGLRLKQNLYREHYEAKTARLSTQLPPQPTTPTLPPPTQAPSPTPAPARSRISGNHLRQPSLSRPTESEGNFSSRPNSASFSTASPVPAFAVSSPRDEPLHAETLASLRKSDAITRRASSRRHSQRFSTLLEQNAPPPMPRRNPDSSNHLSTYPGYQYPVPSLGTSSTSSYPSMPYGQPTPPIPVPYGPTTPQATGTMDTMPLPPTVPVPPPPPPSDSSQPTLELLDVATPTPTPSSDVGAGSDGAPLPSIVLSESSPETVPRPAPEPIVEPVETSLTLFLQVGKSVKKTRFEGGELTHSGLRMLFMEKFQYNPGQDDFPTIYVKDPHTNIHYELESLADVKQNAFLSLNVDEMENIQRKMDQGFAALTKEIHDIKKSHEALEQARQKAEAAEQARQKVLSNTQPDSEGSQALRSVVQKVLAKNKPSLSPLSIVALPPSNNTGSASQTKISAAELKAQHEEIQTLRRDLGIVRQLYTELQTETKSMLGNLAGYTTQIRKQALEAPVSSRLFIESGKVKLDKKSEDLTNKIEELQDVVEDMKLNVTQRRGRPSDTSMAFVDKQCEEIGTEITELSDYIQTLRPSWKKTWEVELQTIVKEQMFLKEQEALLEDLKEDRASLLQTLGNLRKLMELQVKAGGPTREFVFQPVVDEGFEGLKTVMEEVKMIAPDSDKRLRAMAQMEKLRHIELSNRIDEFEEELTTFVGASKLRKTGGAVEVERQRQQRDLENLKAMFGTRTVSQESLVPVVPDEPVVGVKEVEPDLVEEMAHEP